MKVGQIIAMVDELRENEVSDEMKLFWLNEVEGRVKSEIFKAKPEEIAPLVSFGDAVAVKEPYSRIYILYLDAMMLFCKGEYDSYFTVLSEYERAFSEYSKHQIRCR